MSAAVEGPIATTPAKAAVASIVVPRHTSGPPKWKSPIAADKIRREEAPASAAELMESAIAAPPEGGVVGVPVSGVLNPKRSQATGATVAATRKAGIADVSETEVATAREVDEPVSHYPKPLMRAPLKPSNMRIADPLSALISADKVQVKPTVFVPPTRKAFRQFIIQTYRDYKLPAPSSIPNPHACEDMSAASSSEQKAFQYQEFVRDYIQRNSPYRGVLVYHGLGSGKTCTSIAALEALYNAGQKPVYVFTPASLSSNYKEELMKCGPYAFRTKNHWTWVSVPSLRAPSSESELLLNVLGLPRSSVVARKGGWIPDPLKPVNFDGLSSDQKQQIQEQIQEHIRSKIQFVHYNGILTSEVRAWACEAPPKRAAGTVAAGAAGAAAAAAVAGTVDPDAWLRKFDGATIIIDEVHNLVRAINNSDMKTVYKDEPRNAAQYNPAYCTTGKQYKRPYMLYRMLANAVGCKIIALSATPLVNFPQELGILANLLAGDQRMVEVNLSTLSIPEPIQKALREHPEVDQMEIVPNASTRTSLLRITPVPSGFKKVPAGFRRDMSLESTKPEIMRERGLKTWFHKIVTLLESKKVGVSKDIKYLCATRLPDLEEQFRQLFIDVEHTCVKATMREVLMSRLAGLVSFYKGAKADFMAKVTSDELVRVPMSEHQLNVYTIQRREELEKELKQKKKKDLYEQAVTNQSETFKIFSREICNFAFPTDIERPKPKDHRDLRDILDEPESAGSAEQDSVDAQEAAAVEEAPAQDANEIEHESDSDEESGTAAAAPPAAAGAAAAGAAAGGADAAAGPAAGTKGIAVATKGMPGKPRLSRYQLALQEAIRKLKANRAEIFTAETLPRYSPKFQAAVNRIRTCPGTILIYSNFKTTAGVGLFGVTLETQLNYVRLDIVEGPGRNEWSLAPESLGNPGKPRYITYTGDDHKLKRKILLAIFNAQWNKVPPALAAQIQEVGGGESNLRGELVKALLITQTGAEGLNLVNVRQVHLLEPYWNYVRMEQVKGRAVRICSHTALPPEERTVDIFTYVSHFSDKAVKTGLVDGHLMRFDSGLSTDEDMLRILTAKKVLADSITDLMKSSAVDCELNQAEHGSQTCFKLPTPSMDSAFHPLVEVDVRERASLTKTVSAAATAGGAGVTVAGGGVPVGAGGAGVGAAEEEA